MKKYILQCDQSDLKISFNYYKNPSALRSAYRRYARGKADPDAVAFFLAFGDRSVMLLLLDRPASPRGYEIAICHESVHAARHLWSLFRSPRVSADEFTAYMASAVNMLALTIWKLKPGVDMGPEIPPGIEESLRMAFARRETTAI